MPKEINRYRLNYMQAYVKQYDDGSEILQSYNTDVVKKTPDGQYIRLWYGWSPATNKQVSTWCHRSFRDIPFVDGTVEDRKPIYKRKGYNLRRRQEEFTPQQWKEMAKDFAESLSAGQLYLYDRRYGYNTALHKDLKVIYKHSPKYLKLFKVLNACINKKPIRGNTVMNTILMLYDYDFEKIWLEGGFMVEYPNLIANPSGF